MTDGMFCAQYLSQYQEILSKMRLFGTRNCSKLGRSLYSFLFNYQRVDDKIFVYKFSKEKPYHIENSKSRGQIV